MKETKNILPFESGRMPVDKKDQLLMIQVMNREKYDGKIIVVDKEREREDWRPARQAITNDNLITVISRPVTGEIVAAVDSPLFEDARYALETEEILPFGELDYSYVLFKFDGSTNYRSDITVVDGMLVFRIYAFCNQRKDFGAGYYECARCIFSGNNVGYETRDSFDPCFDIKGYLWKLERLFNNKLGSVDKGSKEYSRLIFKTKIKARLFHDVNGIKVLEAIRQTYPELFPLIKESRTAIDTPAFIPGLFISLWTNIAHTERVYKRIPDYIREHLETPIPDEDHFCAPSDGNMRGNYYHVRLFHSDKISCYYVECYDDKGETFVLGERVYITENEILYFRWNPICKKYVSSKLGLVKKSFFRNGEFKIPTKKNGTALDRVVGMNRESLDGFTLLTAIAIPAAESLLKQGFKVVNRFKDSKEILNGKLDNVRDIYYNEFNCTEELREFMEATTQTIKLLHTNKNGLEIFKLLQKNHYCSWTTINIPYFAYMLRTKEFNKISDPELRLITFLGMNNRIPQSEFTEESVQYCLRLAKRAMSSYRQESKNPYNKAAAAISMFNNLDTLVMLYRDYKKMCTDFASITPKLVEIGVDMTQYEFPACPKPSHLQHFHDAVAREVVRYSDLVDTERMATLSKNITKFSETNEYTQFLIDETEKKRYVILPVKTGEDLVREGAFLHHCVGTYRKDMAERRSYIYFLRKTSDQQTPFFTMEVIKKNDTYVLKQCRTFRDKTGKPDSCRQFITDWAKTHNVRISCAV